MNRRCYPCGVCLAIAIAAHATCLFAQPNQPWNAPLVMAWSTDGQHFSIPTTFQDSSGVPSVVQWKGDTLAAVFQWFREPRNTPTWDRVAVKFSYDAGLTWTQPTPIIVTDLPPTYQRPFDPTLTVVAGRLRLYYSSNEGKLMGGPSELINTYSAISDDGITYTFEPGARYDHPTLPVVDPAVIQFRGTWHYCAPVGASQDGAHHATSTNGLDFETQAPYPSDIQHNWTGNFTQAADTILRFYGSGPRIWYAESTDAQSWGPYISTELLGGDPSCIRVAADRWLIVYVGPRYATSVFERSGTATHVECASCTLIGTYDMLGREVSPDTPGIHIDVWQGADGTVRSAVYFVGRTP